MDNIIYFIKSHRVPCVAATVLLMLFIGLPLLLPKSPNKITNHHKASSSQTNNTPYTPTTDDIPNIPQSEIDNLSEIVHNTANLNGIKSKPDIMVRKNSVKQVYNEKNFAYVTDFIVDLPSVKQSYRVHDEYYMIPHGYNNDYALLVTCPHPEDLIYPPFKCIDRIKQEGGTE